MVDWRVLDWRVIRNYKIGEVKNKKTMVFRSFWASKIRKMIFPCLFLLIQILPAAQGYALGDGSTLCFSDATQQTLPCPAGLRLHFEQVPDIDAFSSYVYAATISLTTEFFDVICPEFCNGLNSTAYLALAATSPSDSVVSSSEDEMIRLDPHCAAGSAFGKNPQTGQVQYFTTELASDEEKLRFVLLQIFWFLIYIF